jgi:hypothetical protein
MKKLLLASVLAIASFPGHAASDAVPDYFAPPQCDKFDGGEYKECVAREWEKEKNKRQECGPLETGEPCPPEQPPARVTVAPPYQGPPPIGWVYQPYTVCGDPPRCSMGVVNVQADGLNVRVAPNGPPVMSLVNGVPLIPLQKQGDWLLVAAGCDLTPTWAWSWTAGVPLNRCWVYF